jgi:hypothetical protein
VNDRSVALKRLKAETEKDGVSFAFVSFAFILVSYSRLHARSPDF